MGDFWRCGNRRRGAPEARRGGLRNPVRVRLRRGLAPAFQISISSCLASWRCGVASLLHKREKARRKKMGDTREREKRKEKGNQLRKEERKERNNKRQNHATSLKIPQLIAGRQHFSLQTTYESWSDCSKVTFAFFKSDIEICHLLQLKTGQFESRI